MESLPAAVSLCRALLTLSRARATGVLELRGDGRQCRIALADGVPRAASGTLGAGRPLGDDLIHDGSLDAADHARALGERDDASAQPVGRWLVDRGLSTDGAVETVLRRQLRERLAAVCRCRSLEYRFVAGPADVGVSWLREPQGASDLVLAAMRALLATWSPERSAAAIELQRLRLGSLGHALLRDAVLWPEEQALRALLAEGTTLPEVLHVTGGSLRGLRFVALLALLGGLDDGPARPAYGLLLRKRRQLRQRVAPHRLLEAEADATPADARRALHRLARELHPDRFMSHAPPAVVDASHEVMGALASAERRVRRGT